MAGGKDRWLRSPVRLFADGPLTLPRPILVMSNTLERNPTPKLNDDDVHAIDRLREAYDRLRKELGRVIVGQQQSSNI